MAPCVYLLIDTRVVRLSERITAPVEEIASIELEPSAYYSDYDPRSIFNYDDCEWDASSETWEEREDD